MAEPIEFPESNTVRTAPPDMDNCQDLHIHHDKGQGVCISKWKLTSDELMEVLQTGCVWVWVHSGKTQPPISIEGFSPFEERTNGEDKTDKG